MKFRPLILIKKNLNGKIPKELIEQSKASKGTVYNIDWGCLKIYVGHSISTHSQHT